MKLTISRIKESRIGELPADELQLGFGRYFSDHMFLYDFSPKERWHGARIVPCENLSLSPAAMVLHYGQEVFEGMKAYRGADGGIRLFRHRKNLERLNSSARRLCMPQLDIEEMSDALKQLVLLDREWIPRTEGCALYIRPNYIATEPHLGVRASERYLFYIIQGPVGAYYPEGFNPVRIFVSDTYVRAVKGGVGEAKTGGNYAGSLLAQREAKEKGFTQVLWLDAKELRYVEEVGTMNIFFVIDGEVITSPLTGSILPGVTRDSVLHILRTWGHKVSVRMLGIDEVVAAAGKGTLQEIFGTGTAAVISPVGSFFYKNHLHVVAGGEVGELSRKLYDHILALQYGREEDPYGWVERIDV